MRAAARGDIRLLQETCTNLSRSSQLLNQIPDAGDELTMFLSGEYVREDRGQPFDFLFTSVLLQCNKEALFHFRVITQYLLHLVKIRK